MITATRALKMRHDTDPKEDIRKELADHIDHIEPMCALLLVAVYKRPKMSAGGVLFTDEARKEDDYQGKCGLILKMGPLAFKEAEGREWGGRTPQVGDWISYRVADTWSTLVGERTVRFVDDVNVKAILAEPDALY